MSVAIPPATTVLSFFVDGRAQTAGSKVAVPITKGGRRVSTRLLESGSDASREAKKTWRQDVQHAAREAMREQGWVKTHEAVVLELVFWRQRGAGHYGTGRNAGVLKPSAPAFHIVTPDSTKLTRATEDALKGLTWADDAQVVKATQWKAWTCRFEGREGCVVTIRHATAADLPPTPTWDLA